MKVLVLGVSGMLGNEVYSYLSNLGYDTIGTARHPYHFLGYEVELFDVYDKPYVDIDLPLADYVINCIGVTNRYICDNVPKSIFVNSLFPHLLANWCEMHEAKLIHITTDCVYSGIRGYYTEKDMHDAIDLYGKTKSMGEPDNAMILRTSIIGNEVHNFVNLVSWLRSMDGEEVDGYQNHLWNGITTKCYADLCHQIMARQKYECGISHVFSNEDVTKYELLEMLCDKYDLDIKVKKCDSTNGHVNRTLRSVKPLVNILDIAPLYEQL